MNTAKQTTGHNGWYIVNLWPTVFLQTKRDSQILVLVFSSGFWNVVTLVHGLVHWLVICLLFLTIHQWFGKMMPMSLVIGRCIFLYVPHARLNIVIGIFKRLHWPLRRGCILWANRAWMFGTGLTVLVWHRVPHWPRQYVASSLDPQRVLPQDTLQRQDEHKAGHPQRGHSPNWTRGPCPDDALPGISVGWLL